MRKYFRAAFLYPWNLLAFFGGMGFAMMSPWPDAMFPLVMGMELAYLTGLTAIPRFRTAIDAKEAKEARGSIEARVTSASAQAQLQRMVNSLPPTALRRFLLLRQRVSEMRDIASGVRANSGGEDSASTLQTPALDRLLFLFLKLLVSQAGLERFLRSTSEGELDLRLKDVQKRLATAQTSGDERVAKSLQDSLADATLRLDNYRKSQKDSDFVAVELDRIETKIQALIETGVSRQDPDTFGTQVSAAVDSMQQTEDAVKNLQSLTGLADQLEEPPAILGADLGPKVLGGR